MSCRARGRVSALRGAHRGGLTASLPSAWLWEHPQAQALGRAGFAAPGSFSALHTRLGALTAWKRGFILPTCFSPDQSDLSIPSTAEGSG